MYTNWPFGVAPTSHQMKRRRGTTKRKAWDEQMAARPEAVAAEAARRLDKPSVLRPWPAECLTLRAADDRLCARRVLTCEVDGETVERDPWWLRVMSLEEAERIGLLGVLEAVRAESAAIHQAQNSRQGGMAAPQPCASQKANDRAEQCSAPTRATARSNDARRRTTAAMAPAFRRDTALLCPELDYDRGESRRARTPTNRNDERQPGGHKARPYEQHRPTLTPDPLPSRARGSGARRIVWVEVVEVDAWVVDRLCRWPRLPPGTSATRAAQKLGMGRKAVARWFAARRLAGRARGAEGGRRYRLRYPERDAVLAHNTGEPYRYPHGARHILLPKADVDCAAARIAGQDLRQWLVRVGDHQCGHMRGGAWVHRLWVCPGCGRRVRQVYLPAGPLALAGRTWSAWRWQCWECTGMLSESTIWSEREQAPWNLVAAKLTGGVVSGTDLWRIVEEASAQATEEMVRQRGGSTIGLLGC